MRKHLPFVVFYFFFLLIGILIYKDYGVSWDEGECRIDNGILNTTFIRTHDQKPLLESISKYHGAAFEMFLVVAEKITGVTSTHAVFLLRHILTFILFAVSVMFFYLLCIKAFGSPWLALTGTIMLVLQPRIFADSFYNSKDLPFLSLLIINGYLTILLLEKRNFLLAIVNGVTTGIMIDVRLMGLLLPLFFFIVIIIDLLKSISKKQIIICAVLFSFALIASIIAFWPVLWLGPVHHFIQALKEMSNYPWEGSVLYMEKTIKATELPWHYLIVWILITNPLFYLLLFLSGLFAIIRRGILRMTRIESLSLFLSIFPLGIIILMHSVVYDGWRHVYFIYPFIVLIAISGLQYLVQLTGIKSRKYLIAFVAVYFSGIIITMAELHPFENVYFNFLVKGSSVNGKFETDYWALSYKQAYEYILKNDTSSHIIVRLAEAQPGIDNILFLRQEDRDRISFTTIPELADYYLTCHRYDRNYSSGKMVYNIQRDRIVIHSIYDLRNKKINLTNANIIAEYRNDYSKELSGFNSVDKSSFGEGYESISANVKFAGNFSIAASDPRLTDSALNKYIHASIDIFSNKPFRCMFVFEVDSSSAYHWEYMLISNTKAGKWNKYNYYCKMPDGISSVDKIKLHILNFEGAPFKIDNFSVNIYAVDTASAGKSLRGNL